MPHGLRQRRPPPGEAPPQTYLAAGAVAVGRLAQHPPGRVPSRPFTCQVTAEQEGTHFPPSAPDPRPPVGDSHPYPSRHRGREAATPRHLTEEMKDVKSIQRLVGAPSRLASWVRGYRPHLSSAWGQWPWQLLSLGLRDREDQGRPRTHVDKLGSGAVMRVGDGAALAQGTNPQSLRETFPLSRAVSHEGLSPIKLGPSLRDRTDKPCFINQRATCRACSARLHTGCWKGPVQGQTDRQTTEKAAARKLPAECVHRLQRPGRGDLKLGLFLSSKARSG